jgi:hypothetical protein
MKSIGFIRDAPCQYSDKNSCRIEEWQIFGIVLEK